MNIDNRFTQWLMRGRGIRSRLMTRRCRGCDLIEPHSAHLTRYGNWLLDHAGGKA